MEDKEPELYLKRGLTLAFANGLINREMVKWVLKGVDRAKDNKELMKRLNKKDLKL